MMDTGKTTMANRTTPEEFRQYLIDIESLTQDFADARICVAKVSQIRMMGNSNTLSFSNRS